MTLNKIILYASIISSSILYCGCPESSQSVIEKYQKKQVIEPTKTVLEEPYKKPPIKETYNNENKPTVKKSNKTNPLNEKPAEQEMSKQKKELDEIIKSSKKITKHFERFGEIAKELEDRFKSK